MSSNSAEAKLGVVVDGKYELEALLGQGGMGAVYRARHLVTGRKVGIKWLLEDDPDRRRRFLREARAMGRLAHPNVVQIFDVSEHDGEIFLVMEYLEGKPLRDFVVEDGMPPAEALARIFPAMAGVEAAHRAGILHRDLKPENLLVCCDRDGTPFDTKVLDFGLAKATEADAHSKLTHSGSIVGTPRYMSPEQLEEKPLDARADVYSMALIVFELLVGSLPFRARSLNALLLEILTVNLPSPSVLNESVPAELGEVVRRGLARDPADRFESIEAFARALEPWAGGLTFSAPRAVHSQSDDEVERPSQLDDPLVNSSIRARSSDSVDRPTQPERRGTVDPSDALAPTAAVSAEAVSTVTRPPAKRSIPIAAALGVLGLVGVAIAVAVVLMPDGSTTEELGAAGGSTGDEAVVGETAAPVANDTVVNDTATAEDPTAEDPTAEGAAADVAADNTHEDTVSAGAGETEATPTDDAANGASAARASTRRSSRHVRRATAPAVQTPPAVPVPAGSPDRQVRGRAGVMQSDDF